MSRRPYVREIPKTSWWVGNSLYTRYMAREVTCVFIGIYTGVLLWGIKALSEGRETYDAFLECLNGPVSVLFHVLALAFTVYHATSWFNVTPAAMRIQTGEDFLPGPVIIGAHYGLWVLVTLIVLFMAGV